MLNGITLSFLLITLLSFFPSALLSQDERLTKNGINGNKKYQSNISTLIDDSQTANITKRDEVRGMRNFDIFTIEYEASSEIVDTPPLYRPMVYVSMIHKFTELIGERNLLLHNKELVDQLNEGLTGNLSPINTFGVSIDYIPMPEEYDQQNGQVAHRFPEKPFIMIMISITFHKGYDRLNDNVFRSQNVMESIIEEYLSLQCSDLVHSRITMHVKYQRGQSLLRFLGIGGRSVINATIETLQVHSSRGVRPNAINEFMST